jgi:Holliday junction resolvasome RuvABC endonuclease subunit
MKESFTILTNDPSFTAWGWAVLDNDANIIDCGCIKTAPEQKKRRIRTSDDRTRRTVEITQELLRLIRKYNIKYILTEAPHGSQNASAAVMIGITTGVLTAISECLEIPLESYNEQDSKKCLLGKKAATKQETLDAIEKLYDVPFTGIAYRDEAIADAIAVYHVAIRLSQTLKMMKK